LSGAEKESKEQNRYSVPIRLPRRAYVVRYLASTGSSGLIPSSAILLSNGLQLRMLRAKAEHDIGYEALSVLSLPKVVGHRNASIHSPCPLGAWYFRFSRRGEAMARFLRIHHAPSSDRIIGPHLRN
jgi:hypothetical protein